MKKSVIVILLMFGLVIGFSQPTVFAVEKAGGSTSGQEAEESWSQALKTQVALAKSKVALLRAHIELQLNKDKEEALRYLEEAEGHLSEAYKSADRLTRKRTAELQNQVKSAKAAVRDKGQKAASQLSGLVDKSETALHTAIAETQDKAADVKKETSVRLALAQAKAAQLKAKVALEIDHASKEAGQRLAKAEGYLKKARASASQEAAREIEKLEQETREVRNTLTSDIKAAPKKLDALVTNTEARLKAYGTEIGESKEMGSLRRSYAQIEAQAALLKARLAARTKATMEQAHTYLNEAKTWYNRTRSQAGEAGDKAIADMTKRIDEAGVTLKEKGKEAYNKLAELLTRAEELVKGEE